MTRTGCTGHAGSLAAQPGLTGRLAGRHPQLLSRPGPGLEPSRTQSVAAAAARTAATIVRSARARARSPSLSRPGVSDSSETELSLPASGGLRVTVSPGPTVN